MSDHQAISRGNARPRHGGLSHWRLVSRPWPLWAPAAPGLRRPLIGACGLVSGRARRPHGVCRWTPRSAVDELRALDVAAVGTNGLNAAVDDVQEAAAALRTSVGSESRKQSARSEPWLRGQDGGSAGSGGFVGAAAGGIQVGDHRGWYVSRGTWNRAPVVALPGMTQSGTECSVRGSAANSVRPTLRACDLGRQDANGNRLDGAETYRVTLPPAFRQHASGRSPSRQRDALDARDATVVSARRETVISVARGDRERGRLDDHHLRPAATRGRSGGPRIQTTEGKGWFTLLRLSSGP